MWDMLYTQCPCTHNCQCTGSDFSASQSCVACTCGMPCIIAWPVLAIDGPMASWRAYGMHACSSTPAYVHEHNTAHCHMYTSPNVCQWHGKRQRWSLDSHCMGTSAGSFTSWGSSRPPQSVTPDDAQLGTPRALQSYTVCHKPSSVGQIRIYAQWPTRRLDHGEHSASNNLHTAPDMNS